MFKFKQAVDLSERFKFKKKLFESKKSKAFEGD